MPVSLANDHFHIEFCQVGVIETAETKLGNVHHEGRSREVAWNPTPAFKCELQLPHTASQRRIQFAQRAGVDPAVGA